jgi:hypothetical protein
MSGPVAALVGAEIGSTGGGRGGSALGFQGRGSDWPEVVELAAGEALPIAWDSIAPGALQPCGAHLINEHPLDHSHTPFCCKRRAASAGSTVRRARVQVPRALHSYGPL